MSIFHDILTHRDFNRLTRKLDRNNHHYDSRFLDDDDNFLQIEAMMMGMEFDCEDLISTFLDEEYQDHAAENDDEDEIEDSECRDEKLYSTPHYYLDLVVDY